MPTPSVVLSQNPNAQLAGINLQWTVSNMATIEELNLIYYASSNSSAFNNLELSPNATMTNLNLTQGLQYYFQLQVMDLSGNVAYSNNLQLTAPYELANPVIASYAGLNNQLQITLNATSNLLTNADSVEFILRRQSDNSLFWIVKPYSSGCVYTLSNSDNALLTNYQTYQVACIFQPASSNSTYNAPSAVSNTMSMSPQDFPNVAQSISATSVGFSNLALQLSWAHPSDFAGYSSNFYIIVGICPNGGSFTYTTLAQNLDVLNYTWSNLNHGVQYQASVQYNNVYGAGTVGTSSFISLSCDPDAPTLVSVTPSNQQNVLVWSAPSFTGQSAITGYNILRNGSPIATNVQGLTYTDVTSLSNGTSYSYVVYAVNAVGASGASNAISAIPYGNCSISNVSMVSKTLTATIAPNGEAVQSVTFIALSANPVQSDAPFYQVVNSGISQNLSGTISVSATFSQFAGSIAYYTVIANTAQNSAFNTNM